MCTYISTIGWDGTRAGRAGFCGFGSRSAGRGSVCGSKFNTLCFRYCKLVEYFQPNEIGFKKQNDK